ncbi:hypothetical protein [Kutzneria sp. 744]|uniref:hypothetical protein n=1 Tax=Kutzneria sp. (strain 744) TaxID=345341 RepID=UPI0004BCDCDD|nr:hypothetical protein [Kutzneria sp. 744]
MVLFRAVLWPAGLLSGVRSPAALGVPPVVLSLVSPVPASPALVLAMRSSPETPPGPLPS